MARSLPPIPTPFSQRLDGLRRGVIPVVVWMLALGGSAMLLVNQGRNPTCVGWAPPVQYEISAMVTGKVSATSVELYRPVRRGQLLLQLDDAELVAQIQLAQTEVENLRANLAAARMQSESDHDRRLSDYQVEARRLMAEEDGYRLEALAIGVELEADRVEHQRLKLQTERYAPLVKDKVISELDYDNSRLMTDEVAKRIAQNEKRLERTREVWHEAQARREEFARKNTEPLAGDAWFESLRRAIDQQESLIAATRAQHESLMLHSPVDGQVTFLAAGSGQAVVPGEPLVIVTESTPKMVVAYARESEMNAVQDSMTVEISPLQRKGQSYRAQVMSIGAAAEMLPAQLWRDPARPEYGRPLVIAYDAVMGLVPGERISARINR